MPTLREIGEFEAIRRVIAARPAASPDVVLGGGDDAAVLRLEPRLDLVVTTDAFVERRHWHPELIDPHRLGARLATANLSDLAAMAAQPRWATVSAGLRPEHDLDQLLALDAGIVAALAAHGGSLVGGNFTAVEDAEWISLTLLGTCALGQAWTRAGARTGDLLAVTGHPGRAAAGFHLLRHRRPGSDAWWLELADAWRSPSARVTLAAHAAESGAVTAAIDLSDGVMADLAHVCESSHVGAEIDAASWPRDPLLERAADELRMELRALRYGSSDDYELVLAVEPSHRAALENIAGTLGVPITFAGRFVAGSTIVEIGEDGIKRPLNPKGWDHFAER